MKENLFSEKDSLELISQMLKQTKQNMEVRYGLFHCQSVMGSYMVSDVCSGYSDED